MTSPLDALPADVRQALQAGNTLDAIKRLRHARGVSLISAKRHIDGVVADSSHSAHSAHSTHASHSVRSAHSSSAAPLAPLPLPGRARPHDDRLAPGEMPRSRDATWAWWVFALLIVAGYLRWRGWF